MIKFKNVCKKYENKTIISDFSYEFKNSGFYFIVGSSGSGKTTLLNLIGGLEKPTSGSIEGNDDISYVFQDANLFYDLTVVENVMVSGINKDKAMEFLTLLKIDDLSDKKVNLLSGGERQRVSIARSLAYDSSVILLDEPTGNLDPENSESIICFLKQISLNKLVIMVTHDIEYSKKYGDVILTYENGNIVESIENEIANSENKTKKSRQTISFKFQLLYSLRLIGTRKMKFFISILLTSLSLLLLFFISCILFYDVNTIVSNGIKSDIRSYYSISKTYYNELTEEYFSYSYGEKVEEDLKNIDIVDYVYYDSSYFKDNNSATLIIDDTEYDGIMITDYLADIIFINEDPIGKKIQLNVNSCQKEFEIKEIINTNYQENYASIYSGESGRMNYYDDLKFYYSEIRMSVNSYKSFFDNGVVIQAANFASYDLSPSEFTKSYYNLKYYYSDELQGDDVYVSKKYYEKFMEEIEIPASYAVYDLRSSVNAAKYFNYLNFYDLFKNVNVIKVVETNDFDVYISKEKYDLLIDKFIKYSVEGICVSDDVNIDDFHNNSFVIADYDFQKIYNMNSIFNNEVKVITIIVGIIVAFVAFLAIYLSIVGFLDKKSKEFFIMKCMKASNVRVITIFLLYVSYVVVLGLIVSFILGGLGVNILNDYLMNEIFFLKFKPIIVDFRVYMASIIIVLLSSFAILIVPYYKLNKIDCATLVKQNL